MLRDFIKEYIYSITLNNKNEVSPQILNYISEVFEEFYRDMPLYLIDVQEITPFQTYKKRGDLALILVGFFTEWLNRSRRPLKEEDYISSGKQNYFNAYVYLDKNFGEYFFIEYKKNYMNILRQYDNIYSYIDLFKTLSENFEEYANMLKTLRNSIEKNRQIYKMLKNMEDFLDKYE